MSAFRIAPQDESRVRGLALTGREWGQENKHPERGATHMRESHSG